MYGVKVQPKAVSDYMMSEENLPEFQENQTFVPKAYFGDGREGYDVQYFTKNELISDVLKHYERFLSIISEKKNDMFISSNANRKMK